MGKPKSGALQFNQRLRITKVPMMTFRSSHVWGVKFSSPALRLLRSLSLRSKGIDFIQSSLSPVAIVEESACGGVSINSDSL